jgi:hypothetical protein
MISWLAIALVFPAVLVGLLDWRRGLFALMRHGIGKPEGDGFQLAGVFLLQDGRILTSFRHATSADRPNYLALAKAA